MGTTKEKFLALQTREDVANLLGIKEKSLRYFLYAVKPDNMYYEFTIQKKSGGKRTICAPNDRLKSIQRKLADILICVYKVKPAAHGFVPDKDIVSNAQIHTKRRFVLNMDLEDFFEQINFGRVRGMLMAPPYAIGQEAATVIAQIACYKGRLPQGAPSSPILTNMICAPMDTQLTKVAVKHKLRYSRYADDITFSSFKEELPQGIAIVSSGGISIGKEITDVIQKNGFSINEKKTRMFDQHKRQEVTGLVVNRFVNIPRSYIKEIRSILENCRRTSIYEGAKKYILKGNAKNKSLELLIQNETDENMQTVEAWFIKVLKGKLEYVKHVKGKRHPVFVKYAKELNELCGYELFNIQSDIKLLDKIENSIFILEFDSDDDYIQGSGFIARNLGLLTNFHVTQNNGQYTVSTYKGKQVCSVANDINLKKSSQDIDYACYSFGAHSEDALELGTSKELKIGSHVIMVGYPDYTKGNSPDVQEVSITSERSYMGQKIYTVSGRIIHGASGGVVLDQEHKVVGIIRCGAVTFAETEDSAVQGFIPIDIVINDLREEG